MKYFTRRFSRAIRIIAWHAGGQKEHFSSKASIPKGGFISEGATIYHAKNVELEPEVIIMPSAQLICSGMPPYLQASGSIKIGRNSIIREGAIIQTFGGEISLGANSTVNPYCVIQGNGGVKIADNVLIAAHVSIFSANHVFDDPSRTIRSQGQTTLGVIIEDDVWIGAGSIILDGVRIGRGAVIAAGSVVNRDIESMHVVAGVPARSIQIRKDMSTRS